MNGARKIERVVLGDQVYEAIKERILDQAYAPGEKINVDGLVRELAVSSTPIREALTRLVAEGLVSAVPFVGFATAALPDRNYYEDVYSFRSVLEPWAAAEAARRRPGADVITALRDAVAVMTADPPSREYRSHRAFTEADDRFHRLILTAAGNQVALKSYDDLRFHLHISRLYLSREQDVGITHAEHFRIIDALETGDPEAAAEAMRRHLEGSHERLIK
ncbi:GntR family transcriptional regulator [Bosea sp. 2YAB26]|uniref:GntR family transcriptional regulator n=1 Tax=Bosea sp. 2YAB26 TaxID=3237478 RepID=UPI003F8E9DDF